MVQLSLPDNHSTKSYHFYGKTIQEANQEIIWDKYRYTLFNQNFPLTSENISPSIVMACEATTVSKKGNANSLTPKKTSALLMGRASYCAHTLPQLQIQRSTQEVNRLTEEGIGYTQLPL